MKYFQCGKKREKKIIMDIIPFWSAISILAGACGGGFIYLSSQFSKFHKETEKIQIELANKPSVKDVADDYARKEVVGLQFKAIEKDVRLILEKISELKKGQS